MNPIEKLISDLHMDIGQFANFLHVDVRIVNRWISGTTKPSGTASAVIAALREASCRPRAIELVHRSCGVGGISYLLVIFLKEGA